IRPIHSATVDEIRQLLNQMTGDKAACQIDDSVGGIGAFLAGEFAAWHGRLYRRRPVFWAMGRDDRAFLVHHVADATALGPLLARIGQSLPAAWQRWTDDGVTINLAPLADHLLDRQLRRSLGIVANDLAAGGFGFSRTAA